MLCDTGGLMGCGRWLLEVRMIILHCMYALRKYYISDHRAGWLRRLSGFLWLCREADLWNLCATASITVSGLNCRRISYRGVTVERCASSNQLYVHRLDGVPQVDFLAYKPESSFSPASLVMRDCRHPGNNSLRL